MSIHPSIRRRQPLAGRVRSALTAVALSVLVAPSLGWAQTTLETLDLTGPVAAVEEYREFPDTTDRQLFQTWAFDASGFATERVFFLYDFRDGSVRGRQVTSYDGGRPLATVAYDADEEPTAQTVYRYDGEDRLTEEVAVDAEGVETRRVVYEHDAAGHVVRTTQYRNGELDRSSEADYDADGDLLERRDLDAEGRLTRVSRYDASGLEREYVQYDEEGEVEATGRVIEGEHGTVLIEVFDADGNVSESYAWTYDELGRVLERRSVYDDGDAQERLTYAYDDDAQGNWIRQTTTEDLGNGPELYEIRDRTITYR